MWQVDTWDMIKPCIVLKKDSTGQVITMTYKTGACTSRKMPTHSSRSPLGSSSASYPTQIMAPVLNQETRTIAETLVDKVFLRFSAPEQLHSDQGRQFESQLLSEVCKLMHIHKTRTTPYHPQSDGLVERFNRTMLAMLATCAKDNPLDWEKHVRKVCMAYNTSVQASTGYTPCLADKPGYRHMLCMVRQLPVHHQ